jgi:hypothetical protein
MPCLAALTRTGLHAAHRLAVLEPEMDMFEKEDASGKPIKGFVTLERRCTGRANPHAKEAAFASKKGLKSEFLEPGQG